jgi:hypothetical protein
MAIQSSPRVGFGPRLGMEVVGLVAAVAAGVGIGALVFNGSESGGGSSQVTVNPAPAAPAVVSVSGVGTVSQDEFLKSAYTVHESYMEALFGSYSVSVPSEATIYDFEAARAEHDRLIPFEANPQGRPAFSQGYRPANEGTIYDFEVARAEHDRLIPFEANQGYRPANEGTIYDFEAARAEHDRLLPSGAN